MGYFSNGSEGSCYQSQYCDNCVHDVDQSCRVWLLHLTYNYDACKDTERGRALAEMLNGLIPRDADGGNHECSMFVPIEPKVPA
jgi:hypothetical protein